MAIFKPFCSLRPKKEYAQSVAALPYDVMNSEEARKEVKGKPYSFIHVDKAEVDLPENTYIYSDEVYKKAADNLEKLKAEGILKKDKQPCFYIYRQEMRGASQTGIVGCAGVEDYINNVIKKHELTRADKEADRMRHIDVCNANTGPIFLAYSRKTEIDAIIDKYIALPPEYDFISKEEVKNTVWVISDENDIGAITKAFASVPALYIADGHHRTASAFRVALKRREEHPEYTGNEEFNFFLAVCFRADELKIFDYNRLVKDNNGLTDKELFSLLGKNFEIETKSAPYSPEKRHTFGFYYKDKWYKLTLKSGHTNENDIVASLDVSVLQELIISPIFGIKDVRKDSRIDFVGGIRGLKELEKRCHEDMIAAFSMFPTSLEELMKIADAGKIMPPKSTWFEPKLLSGLFIHSLS